MSDVFEERHLRDANCRPLDRYRVCRQRRVSEEMQTDLSPSHHRRKIILKVLKGLLRSFKLTFYVPFNKSNTSKNHTSIYG